MKKFGTPDGGALGSDTDGAVVVAPEPPPLLAPLEACLRWWPLGCLP
jgi:hypothetical protein